MWASLLVLALLTTINPVRLGLVLLVLSRSRPMQSLLAYWVGAIVVGLASLVIPLVVLHANPTSASFLNDFADPTANPTAQEPRDKGRRTGRCCLTLVTVIGLSPNQLSSSATVAGRSSQPPAPSGTSSTSSIRSSYTAVTRPSLCPA